MDKLERCFKGTEETPPRLLPRDPSIKKAKRHLEKADKNLRAMNLMKENKFFDWSISCGYYAMYHATLGSLWLIGIEARSHACAIEAFKKFYIEKAEVDRELQDYIEKAEKLDKKYSDTLETAKSKRIKAQYGLSEIKSEEAKNIQKKSKRFVNKIEELVNSARGISTHKI